MEESFGVNWKWLKPKAGDEWGFTREGWTTEGSSKPTVWSGVDDGF